MAQWYGVANSTSSTSAKYVSELMKHSTKGTEIEWKALTY